MARRKSLIAKRLSKMRGITPIEKDLLKRIGEIADGAINNRGPANPGISGLRRTVRSPLLPPPRGIVYDVGPKRAKIEWNPIDSPVLNFYEVQVTNNDTNISTLKLAFTNRIFISDSGTFTVKVRSVARNGDASPYSSESVTFTIQDDVLFLDGNKFDPLVTDILLFEDIFTPLDYKVFAWGAYNLADFVDTGANDNPVMDLSVNGFYPILSRLFMPIETESFSNVDDASITGETRPGTGTRGGMLQTNHAAMFRPFYIDPGGRYAGLIDTTPTFYMFMNQRDDAAAMSLSLFSIPAAISESREETFNLATSYRMGLESTGGGASVTNIATGTISSTPLSIGNQFTIGFWMKWFWDWDDVGTSNITFNWSGDDFTTWDSLNSAERTGTITIELANNPVTGIARGAQFSLGNVFTPNNVYWELNGTQHADLPTVTTPNINDFQGKWVFVSFSFDSAQIDRDNLSLGLSNFGSSKQAMYLNGDFVPFEFRSSLGDPFITGTQIEQLNMNSPSAVGDASNELRIYQIAMWDGLLGDGGAKFEFDQDISNTTPITENEHKYISNHPGLDLRVNSGDYVSAERLVHYWTFGNNPTPATPSDLVGDRGFGIPIDILENANENLNGVLDTISQDRPLSPGGTDSGTGESSL